MATTSPDNLRTPDPGDPYNLVPDLATLAGDVQTALNKRSITPGTVAQRTAFTASATAGWLWQDTDGMKMLWRKDGAVWVPAVWRWSGTNSEMTAFSAPNGFEWFNVTDGNTYLRVGGAWGKRSNVVSATSTTSANTSGTAFIATPITAQITPSLTTSKVLITTTFTLGSAASGGEGVVTLFRGGISGTNLGNGTNGMGHMWANASAIRVPSGLTFLDSPGSTATQTYTVAIRSISGAFYVTPSSSTASIVLQEIL